MIDFRKLSDRRYSSKHLSVGAKSALNRIINDSSESPYLKDDVCDFVMAYTMGGTTIEVAEEIINEVVKFYKKGNAQEIVEYFKKHRLRE